MSKLSVIIPAAGKGIRLKPCTNTIPKPLINVGNKAILGHILDKIKKLKPNRVYIVIGHLAHKIRFYVKKKYPSLKVTFVEQNRTEGLGHAVLTALKKINKNSPVFIILGDTIVSDNFKPIVKKNKNCIAVKKVKKPKNYGIVEVKKNIITHMVEKPKVPKSDLAIVGIYYFTDSFKLKCSLTTLHRKHHTTKGEFQLTDAMADLINDGVKIYAHKITSWYDCGNIKMLLKANKHLLSKMKTKKLVKSKSNTIKNPVFISPKAKIKNSIIGPYVSIGEGVLVRNCKISNAIICQNTKINDADIKGTIIHKKRHPA